MCLGEQQGSGEESGETLLLGAGVGVRGTSQVELARGRQGKTVRLAHITGYQEGTDRLRTRGDGQEENVKQKHSV